MIFTQAISRSFAQRSMASSKFGTLRGADTIPREGHLCLSNRHRKQTVLVATKDGFNMD